MHRSWVGFPRCWEILVPGGRIFDAPRYAWRGLSLDLARTFFTLDEVGGRSTCWRSTRSTCGTCT
jgi:hypothetical protein